MDVGAPEMGLIALRPSRAGEAWSGGEPSWRRSFVGFPTRLLQRQASIDPAALRPGGGSDTFCVVDNVLELAAARAKTSWHSNGQREKRCRSKVRPLTRSGDFDAAADRQLSTLSGHTRIAAVDVATGGEPPFDCAMLLRRGCLRAASDMPVSFQSASSRPSRQGAAKRQVSLIPPARRPCACLRRFARVPSGKLDCRSARPLDSAGG
jgi:hypothetical protein